VLDAKLNRLKAVSLELPSAGVSLQALCAPDEGGDKGAVELLAGFSNGDTATYDVLL